MRWYEDLYVGYNLLDKKRQVIRKIKNGKPQLNKYVITLPQNDYDTLEIYPSNILNQKWYRDSDMVVVGITEGMEEAMDMIQKIERQFDAIEKRYNRLIEQKTMFASRAVARIRYILQEGNEIEDQTVALIHLLNHSIFQSFLKLF